MTGRRTYFLTSTRLRPPCELGVLRQACTCLLDAVEDLGPAVIDAYTDCRTLPPQAAAALADLRTLEDLRRPPPKPSRWRKRPRRPDHTGIQLDLVVPVERQILLDFAPYSISVELFRASDDTCLLDIQDSGSATFIHLTDQEHATFLAALARAGITDVDVELAA